MVSMMVNSMEEMEVDKQSNHVGKIKVDGQRNLVQVGNNYYYSVHGLRLPFAKGATFDSHDEEHNSKCHPDTRIDLLGQIEKWANNPHSEYIFWLNGMAG